MKKILEILNDDIYYGMKDNGLYDLINEFYCIKYKDEKSRYEYFYNLYKDKTKEDIKPEEFIFDSQDKHIWEVTIAVMNPVELEFLYNLIDNYEIKK